MSVNSSKPPAFKVPKTHSSSKRNLQAGTIAVVGFPVWVAASFLFAQMLVVGVIWILQRIGIVPALDTESTLVNAVFAALIYIATLAIVMGVPYLARRIATTKEQLGLTRLLSWTDILLALAGGIVYVFSSVVILAIAVKFFPAINPDQVQDTGFHNLQDSAQYLLAFVTLIVVAPLAEEILFRGYLYGNVRRHAPAWLSILVTSALFGLAHMQWNVGLDTFALSLVLCSLREVTGSIWAGILLHMLKNGVAFYLLFIMPSGLLN